MKSDIGITSSIVGLFLSFSSLATAHAIQGTRALPQCGGYATVGAHGTGLSLQFKDVRNCSIVSVGAKSMKMTKTPNGYSFFYEISLMDVPAEVLIHSNSRKTMDRIPLYNQDQSITPAVESQIQAPSMMTDSKIKLMDICQNAFDGSANEARCLQIAMNRRLDARIIQVCEDAFDGDQNELSCLEIAPSPEIISICEQVFDGDDNELKCLSLAQSVAVVQACENAFDGDQNELECLRYSGRGDSDAVVLIRKCEEQKNGDAEELECMKMMIGLRVK
jgi:hypothetical protein